MMKKHLPQSRRVATILLLVFALVLLATPIFADSGPSTTRTTRALIGGNQPPVVDAGGPYASNEGQDIILAATAQDVDNDPLTYMWTVDQPTKCAFASPTQIQPTLSCSDNGVYDLTLKVDDGVNSSVIKTAKITVSNVAPTATFGNDGPVDEGSAFTLSLTDVVEPGVLDTYFYTFDCGDGYGYTPHSFIDNTTPCATTDNGTRTVRGRIQDKDDGYSVYTDTVTVNNVVPTVTAGSNQNVDEGDTVNLDPATFTDPGTADTHTATIDWGDGNTTDPAVVTGDPGDGSVTGSHVYADNGSYTVEVCVTDDDGGTNCDDTLTVTVNNVAPTVNAGPDLFGYEGKEVVLSDPTFTDPGTADTHTATIDWGDGTVTDPATLTEPASPGTVSGNHTYVTQGTYTVTVMVEDDDGAWDTDTLLINVAEVWRFRGYLYDGPVGDLSFSLADATLQVYGLNDGDPGPATLVATTQSLYDGFFNFAIIEPWVYDTFTLMAVTPAGMVPMGAWSEDGTVVDAQTVQWYQPDSVAHENAFFFEVPTVPPTEPVTATITLPLLNDTWVTVGDPATMGDPDTNYDPYGALVIRPTGLDNALMVFDRSSLPQNATIINAELTVNVVLQTGAEGKQLAAMNVETFTPALVTYTTAPNAFNPGPAVDVPITPGLVMLDVSAQVTAWGSPALTSYNRGYLALSATGPAGRISLDSLESSPGTPATLTVTYTTP